MNNLEALKATYSKTLQRLGIYQSAENHAHNKVKEYTEKLEGILKEIKEIEENKYKLNKCIDLIKHYCAGKRCSECMFFDEYGRTLCQLNNVNPTQWKNIK
jgi:SMC interacting uncharacterized protein involved in chromosome segregation